jgi:hypothetical protein
MAEARSGATGAQLKHDIDSGRTGDKIPVFDPAAAPLGTDEEAAGTPTPPEAWQAARESEARPDLRPAANVPDEAPLRSHGRSWPIFFVIFALAGMALWFAAAA